MQPLYDLVRRISYVLEIFVHKTTSQYRGNASKCSLLRFPLPPIPNVLATNIKYHGWNVQIKNLFFANGIRK